MSKINDGGPVFPVLVKVGDVATSDGGMSLRDYFAGQALAHLSPHLLTKMHLHGVVPKALDIAALAYEVADAMLAAREEGR